MANPKRSRIRSFWLALMCELWGHHYGEAACLGLARGIVCYQCGRRLHACHRGCRHGA